MTHYRRVLEEVALSALLNQISETQIQFLTKINTSKISLGQSEKEYHTRIVKKTLQDNYDRISTNQKISTLFKQFSRDYFSPQFLIEKLYHNKGGNPASVTREEFTEVMYYYSSDDNTQYESKYVAFLFEIIYQSQDKDILIRQFYDNIYISTSHSKRVSLMNSLLEKKKRSLMDRICTISEEKGLPGIVFEEANPSPNEYDIIILNNTTEKRCRFKGNETVFALITSVSLAFNINFCFYFLSFEQKGQKQSITFQMSNALLKEIINSKNEFTSISMMLIEKGEKQPKSISDLYYNESNLQSPIQSIIRKWKQSLHKSELIAKEHFFPHLHNHPFFTSILQAYFAQFSKISMQEFLETTKANEHTFCIFHLIVGFDDNEKPFLMNTSYFEMPRTILTHPFLKFFDSILPVKRDFKKRANKSIETLVSDFYFNITKDLTDSTWNCMKNLFDLYSQTESEEERTPFKKLIHGDNSSFLLFHITRSKSYWVYALYVHLCIHNVKVINEKGIEVIWDCFHNFNDEEKSRSIEDLTTLFAKMDEFKGFFLSLITSGLLNNYYAFVCDLFKATLCNPCRLDDQDNGNLLALFHHFDSKNPMLYSTVLFFYGFYFPTKIDTNDIKSELLESTNRIYDKFYQFSVYYFLHKQDQHGEMHIQISNLTQMLTVGNFTISIEECRIMLLNKELPVICNDLLESLN